MGILSNIISQIFGHNPEADEVSAPSVTPQTSSSAMTGAAAPMAAAPVEGMDAEEMAKPDDNDGKPPDDLKS